MPTSSRARWSVVIAAVIIVAALVVFSYVLKPSEPRAAHAPKGEIVAGFPRELILDDEALIGNSYSIEYNENINQYAATFSSARPMEDLLGQYKSYLVGEGWSITNEINKYPNSRGIYARKGNQDVNVVIADQGSSREVMVSYLEREEEELSSRGVKQPSAAEALVLRTKVLEALGRYFDFSQVHPRDFRVDNLDAEGQVSPEVAGSSSRGEVHYSLTLDTGHLLENYANIKEDLESAGFVLAGDSLRGTEYNIAAEKDAEIILVFAFSPDSNNRGSITMVLIQKK